MGITDQEEQKTMCEDETVDETVDEKTSVYVDVKNADFAMLRGQKRILFEMIKGAFKDSPREKDALEGILSFLDDIQDQAALTLGEEAVFGEDTLGTFGNVPEDSTEPEGFNILHNMIIRGHCVKIYTYKVGEQFSDQFEDECELDDGSDAYGFEIFLETLDGAEIESWDLCVHGGNWLSNKSEAIAAAFEAIQEITNGKSGYFDTEF